MELHPLIVFLEEQIAVQQSDSWMKRDPSTKLMQEEDKHLCFLLMFGMAGTNSAVAIGSQKAMLCKAFGLAGRSKVHYAKSRLLIM